MKKQTLFLILVLNSMLQSCDGESQTKENIKSEIVYAEKSIPDQEHNSMNSLDWNGTYKGVLPCASCEGIETILTLNSDQSYVLITNYLGRNDALEQEKRGEFSWNEDSSIITLTNINSGPNQYKVGENRIWHLDETGEIITGDLEDHYVLTKSL
ncbi:MAG: putative lipoprotein NlpE involved in copper resistance [Algoriphagus sp.]|jgi:uncharacterized lipoprotein NlpE involved in copper resistance|tara:strand:+ start:777 stop:1241 length:465 start_codon:yes stop_codon:yes gene_type:complete